MSVITIKKIESENELKFCADILVDAYNGEPWNDEWTRDKALEKLVCFFHSPKFHGWMAFENNKLSGCCVGNIEPYFSGDYFYLKEMFVLTKFQKKGIGKAMMSALREFLSEINIDTIILFTAKDFFPFDFYLKTGFSEMEGMRMMSLSKDNQA